MKNLLKILTFGAALVASTSVAFASPMVANGSTLRICCNSTVTVVGSGATSGLLFSNPEPTTHGTGGLQFLTSLTLSNTFLFSGIHPGAGELLFTGMTSGNTVQFFVTGYSLVGSTYTFTGYTTLNGVAGTNATLTELTGNPAPGGGNYFEGDLVTTPEPSSLILLGTGLAGAAGLMLRRRKLIQA